MCSKAVSTFSSEVRLNRLLFGSLIVFLGLLIALEHSKLTNNFFYVALMPAAFVLMYHKVARPSPVAVALFGYLIYIALSTFWGNSDLGDGFKQLKYVVYIFSFVAVAHHVASSPNRILMIAGTMLTLAVFLEAHSLYSQISVIGLENWLDRFPRLSQTTGPLNPVYLALTIGLFGFILISSRIHNPWIATGLVCLLVLLTLPLQSRTLILALVVAHSYKLIQQRAFRALTVWAILCAIAGVAILIGVDRFSSSVLRDDIWQFAFKTWIKECSILFGCGNRYDFDIHTQGMFFYNPHSVVFSQLLYGGLIGSLLIAIFVYTVARKTHQTASFWTPVFIYSAVACTTIGHSLLTHPDFLWILTWLPISFSGILFRSVPRNINVNPASQFPYLLTRQETSCRFPENT